MPTETDLLSLAQEACTRAYAPYSNFHIGVALVTAKGNVFTGCNVENASYGLTICAERNAIFAAVNAEGPDMKIANILIVEEKGEAVSPCGACRQVIAEFSYWTDDKTTVTFKTAEGMTTFPVDEVLPHSFHM